MIATLRVAPGVRLRSGTAPRSNAATIEFAPCSLEWWTRILPTTAAIEKRRTQERRSARAADVKWSNHRQESSFVFRRSVRPIAPAIVRGGRRWAAIGDRESVGELARNRRLSLRSPPSARDSPSRRRGGREFARPGGLEVRRRPPEAVLDPSHVQVPSLNIALSPVRTDQPCK